MAVHNNVFALKLAVLLLSAMTLLSRAVALGGGPWESFIRTPVQEEDEAVDSSAEKKTGTRWAVLVAGSPGFGNYRHQADVCHAYQLLRRGGLKDENIVVFMFDDIAKNQLNPRPGVIINHPEGGDVYAGVPRDYTGEHVTAENLYAVLLGDKKGLKGGSGKVVDSKPNDRIFVYYSDHGGPGVLGMPNMPYVYANDFINALKNKHAGGGYKEMVLYIEACESGSIFEGLMPEDLNVYVTTASNAEESSWGTYCPGMEPPPPPEYMTCLADLYSVSWMEDSETHNLRKETIKEQYRSVKERTSNYNTYNAGSHVMEYGNKSIKGERVCLYQGFDPANINLPLNKLHIRTRMEVVNQRDADLIFLWEVYKRSTGGLEKKREILRQIREITMHRMHLDGSIKLVGELLFGAAKGPSTLSSIRASGSPLVDDWACLKSMVRMFETHCGSLTQYGMKHMRAFANICNNGIPIDAMEQATMAACSDSGPSSAKWHPSNYGCSA